MATKPSDAASIAAELKRRGSSRAELLQLIREAEALEKRLALAGPQDDDELHAWIRSELGLHIPRVAVCDDHDAPFKFIADLYFERVDSALLMANRGGSKTFQVAILHLLNSRFKPGVESATVGAIEAQARRCYAHLLKLVEKTGQDDISATIMSETRWKNGSRVEVLPGTVSAVNGPHPQKVHADEVELMDPLVFQESRSMAQSVKLPDGRLIKAQDIITSTRKRGAGPMQRLLDEISEAELQGKTPPYKLFKWCCFESAASVPNCQVANPGCENPCPCDDVVKGRWDDGSSRTLKDVCKGRLARSDGWIPLGDLINIFTHTDRSVWDAQHECIKPSTEGLVIPQWARETHCVRKWDADPNLGPIFMSVDFGGTNPHAVNWYQLLRYDVEVEGYGGKKARLPEGSRVCFDEIYKAEIGNLKLADLIVQKEQRWRDRHRRWRVAARFADPQAKAARLDFAKHNPPLGTVWRVTREITEHIKICVNLIEDDLFYVDYERCPMFVEEIEAWHYPPKRADMLDDPEVPVDDFNHCMSNWRYAMANVRALERGGLKAGTLPTSSARRNNDIMPGVPASTGGQGLPPSESWRRGLGEPVQLPGTYREVPRRSV